MKFQDFKSFVNGDIFIFLVDDFQKDKLNKKKIKELEESESILFDNEYYVISDENKIKISPFLCSSIDDLEVIKIINNYEQAYLENDYPLLVILLDKNNLKEEIRKESDTSKKKKDDKDLNK